MSDQVVVDLGALPNPIMEVVEPLDEVAKVGGCMCVNCSTDDEVGHTLAPQADSKNRKGLWSGNGLNWNSLTVSRKQLM